MFNMYDATPLKVKSTKEMKKLVTNTELVNRVFIRGLSNNYVSIKKTELNDYFPDGMVVEYFRANFQGMQSNGDLFVTRFI